MLLTLLSGSAGCGSNDSAAPTAPGRRISSLNDAGWRFMRQDFDNEQPVAAAFDDAEWLGVELPHDWNGGSDGVHDDVFDGPEMYMGPGWYRTELAVAPEDRGRQLSLRFEAVSSQADVWLNGVHLGQHHGGYTAFEFDVTEALNFDGDNTLVVRASNENDPQLAPWMAVPFGRFPSSSDYALYGGIYRDVWLVATDPVAIDSHFHETPEVDREQGRVDFRTRVSNQATEAAETVLVTELVDADGTVVETARSSARIEPGESTLFEGSLGIDEPKLWSPKSPYLYSVRSRLERNGVAVDEVSDALGFRWYTLENGTGFVLNGEESFLQGTNRHQDMAGLGYALPNDRHRRDVELLKNLGFNFLRHAHYPADEAVVQACDELGMMLWLEIPVSTTVSDDPEYLETSRAQLQEMIEQSYNHPSVIVWGLGNESDRIAPRSSAPGAMPEASREYTTEFLTELNTLAKELDSTRPTTGCNFQHPDNQAIVDVYSPQDWTGWYNGVYTQYAPDSLIGEYGTSIHLDHHDETFVSSGNTQQLWPQEYATEYHEYKASLGRSMRGEFPGHLVWVGFDFASPRRDRETNPIPFMNQKGLFLHDHETRKDVAYFYESFYTAAEDNPMVYIVSETWLDRITEPGTIKLWAYSNAETVELFNGTADDPKRTSLGTRARDAGPRGDTRFEWDDASVTGPVLTAEASTGGEVIAQHSITFEGDW